MLIDGHDAAARLRRALNRAPTVFAHPTSSGREDHPEPAGKQVHPECTIDAENPVHAARLADAMLALSGLSGLITIDEAQRIPGLFPVVRVLVDRPGMPAPSVIGADLRPVVDAPYR